MLPHNQKNAVTHSIDRVPEGNQTAIRKILNGHNSKSVAPEWRASNSPSHWNYWRREALVYQSELTNWLEDASQPNSGVRLAKLYRAEVLGEAQIELLLEDIPGRSGTALTWQDYATAAQAWGQSQAQMRHQDWDQHWLSRSFLRDYTNSKRVNFELLDDHRAWAQPLIADSWPTGLREQLAYLYAHREDLYQKVEAAPQAPSHLDFWPNNLFVDEQGYVVPIDWAFFGHGALGEDIANFIPDAVFDGFVAPERLSELETHMIEAYLQGLNLGGYNADAAAIRSTVHACAVKYVWLGPLLLQAAGNKHQLAYGGQELADANEQFRVRGLALAFLCDWAEQALSNP